MIGIYSYLSFFTVKQDAFQRATDQAVEKFRRAEERVEQKVRKEGSIEKYIEKYLESHPMLSNLFQGLSLFVCAAVGIGLILDCLFLFSPGWRRGLSWNLPPPVTDWKFSMLVKVILLFITGSFAVSVLITIAKRFLPPDLSINYYLLLHTTISDILIFGIIVGMVREYGGDWRDLGFRLPPGGPVRELLFGLGAYLAVLPVFIATLLLLIFVVQQIHYEPPPHPLVGVFLEEEERSKFLIFYSIFLATVIGPIFEEIFFRGFCYSIFKKGLGRTFAMILSAAFFAGIHGNGFAFLPIFILGLCLAYVYEKRGSLLAPMALHIIHNAVFISYFFLAKNLVTKESGVLAWF